MKLLTAPKEPYLTKCKHFFSKSKDFSNFFEIEGENETFSIISSKLWPFHGILSQQCVNVLRKAVLFFSRLRLSSWNLLKSKISGQIPNKRRQKQSLSYAFYPKWWAERALLLSFYPKIGDFGKKERKTFFLYIFLSLKEIRHNRRLCLV